MTAYSKGSLCGKSLIVVGRKEREADYVVVYIVLFYQVLIRNRYPGRERGQGVLTDGFTEMHGNILGNVGCVVGIVLVFYKGSADT